MKRIISLFMAVLLFFSLSACKIGNAEPEIPSQNSQTESSSEDNDLPDNDKDDIDASELEKLTGVNKLRVDYDLGLCRNLSGKISVVLFYMNDFESEWSEAQMDKFTENEVKPGLEFLEKQAAAHNVELDLNIAQSHSLYYDEKVILDIKETGLATVDVMWKASRELGYPSDEAMIEDYKEKCGTEEVIYLTIFNKNGTAYAINPTRGSKHDFHEHCIIFAYDLDSNRKVPSGYQASVIAHEILHLFGAEDFYSSASRKSLAKIFYPSDIMLGANYNIKTNNIGKATAFYIGWTDTVPEILYSKNW